MYASLQCIVDYAFDIMCVNRIDAFTLPDNLPFHNLLKKIGFNQEGCLKKYRKVNSHYVDIFIFGIVNQNA